MKDKGPGDDRGNNLLQVFRCTVTAVSDEVPYVLASAGPGASQYALNKRVSGAMWGYFRVGQLIDIHLIPDAPRPSKIIAVYPVTDF